MVALIKKNYYISLGPFCYAASILAALDLREASYIFDWCQSGSSHHVDALILSPNDFYEKHILPPIVNNGPESLKQIPCMYGFNNFYNPHRKPGENKGYFIRALSRFQDLCFNPEIRIIFVLADYIDKPGNTFLDNTNAIARFVEMNLMTRVKGSSLLCIHRTQIVNESLCSQTYYELTPKTILVTEYIPKSIEETLQFSKEKLFSLILQKMRGKVLQEIGTSIH